ncbi:MAG: FHA domain-containing protein, partial [Thermoguttaceae bacterium]
AGLTVPHPLISRRHCELFEQNGLLMLRDLGSLNGTLIGGRRVALSPLPPGAKFTVGPVTFQADYQYEGDLAALPSPQFLDGPRPEGHSIEDQPSGPEDELPEFFAAEGPAEAPAPAVADSQVEVPAIPVELTGAEGAEDFFESLGGLEEIGPKPPPKGPKRSLAAKPQGPVPGKKSAAKGKPATAERKAASSRKNAPPAEPTVSAKPALWRDPVLEAVPVAEAVPSSEAASDSKLIVAAVVPETPDQKKAPPASAPGGGRAKGDPGDDEGVDDFLAGLQ